MGQQAVVSSGTDIPLPPIKLALTLPCPPPGPLGLSSSNKQARGKDMALDTSCITPTCSPPDFMHRSPSPTPSPCRSG